MGIQFWFRRLVSLFGSSKDAVPCSLCRTAVPPSHFRKGRAVLIAQKAYCAGCVEEITVRKTGTWPLAGAEAHSSSTVHLP